MAFSPQEKPGYFLPERSVSRYTYMRLRYEKLSCKKKKVLHEHIGNGPTEKLTGK
jgi:hypothetical protein